jgi:hypothetical protein
VTESSGLPPNIFSGIIHVRKVHCVDKRVLKFQRFLSQALDPLTTARLAEAVKEMEASKAELHPDKNG